jgi:hypothetical protein
MATGEISGGGGEREREKKKRKREPAIVERTKKKKMNGRKRTNGGKCRIEREHTGANKKQTKPGNDRNKYERRKERKNEARTEGKSIAATTVTPISINVGT